MPATWKENTFMFNKIANLIIGGEDRAIKSLQPTVNRINELEAEFHPLSDDELRAKTEDFRKSLKNGSTLEDILPMAFACVREASVRTVAMRHFDVQLLGGVALHEGKITEMRTGEGKTLVATLPTYLNALTGNGVHVVTVNDYLAKRDSQWMGAIYHSLGLTIGTLQHESAYVYDPTVSDAKPGYQNLRPVSRKEGYETDITYGTNSEFGFDYLRDNMVTEAGLRVQRPLNYGIVDEVDNILVDEARTPLIISGPAEESPKDYQQFARIVPTLKEGVDYTIDEKHRAVSLTAEGMTKLEKLLHVENLYGPENFRLVHFAENALKAHAIYEADKEYVVKDGEVVIVDEFTGRLTPGRRFSDGLHQAIEAKERVPVQRESVTYASITLQNYFRLYDKLAGMTGTAITESEEFWKIYKLDVLPIPTNLPMVREDQPDLIYKDEKAKYRAIVDEIERKHQSGQPVLVGTTDISKSESLSKMLSRRKIPHEVLNAKQHEKEAGIVGLAGRAGAVTVATNMAGRGTDIVLGGNPDIVNIPEDEWKREHQRIIELGGLFILGTEKHEARRIDNQLRGRSGRQGDPGESRFYVALDDALMKRFGGARIQTVMGWAGLEEDAPLENKMVTKAIEGAQVKVEAHHFDIRKHLVQYDDVVNTHRGVIYDQRNKVLDGADVKANVKAMLTDELNVVLDSLVKTIRPEEWDIDAIVEELQSIVPLDEELGDPDNVAEMREDELREKVVSLVEKRYEEMEQVLTPEGVRHIERELMLRVIDAHWVQHLTSMENLRQGIGLYAYGQRDPLVMYKKQGFDQFLELQERIQSDMARMIFHFQITPDRARNQSIIGKKSNTDPASKDLNASHRPQPNGATSNAGPKLSRAERRAIERKQKKIRKR
ncbi:MAG: preprotein translocase subunit SecA [SAR202 cluster bacterium]|nr:preprotein translocase subunit SecA [SAR202 cluster bacterium]